MKTTLDELLVFVMIADGGSFTAASERLRQAPSAISRTLRKLEEKLVTTLVRRTTRRIELTEEGALFLEYARMIIDSVDAAEELITMHRQTPVGTLRVNAAAPFMQRIIVPMIDGFQAVYPGIEIELHTSDEVIDLLEHRVDVAIRIGTLRDSTLHARCLGTSRLRILASPEYLREHGRLETVDDLADHRVLGFSQPDSLNDWPVRHALSDSLRIKPGLRASSGETLLALALAGHGIVCLADYMTREHRRNGDLAEVLTAETVESSQSIHAVFYRNTSLSSRIANFLDHVRTHLDDDAYAKGA
jgi:DNA-binding transcriptional LysR family regulator